MAAPIRLLLALVSCATLVALLSQPVMLAQAEETKAYSSASTLAATDSASTTSALLPLSLDCDGTLPPNEGVPVCCMSGYVFIDGEAVSGAKVTITNKFNGKSIVQYTFDSPSSSTPYFRTSLSRAPLNAEAGDKLTIKAEYSRHTQTIEHVVIGGGQQVDVVLPREVPVDDYVSDRLYGEQPEPDEFNELSGVAIDQSGIVYVVDSQNNRVQVFDQTGQFLRQWGLQGDLPGQFFHPVGILIDKGIVYITDERNSRIQVFTNTGTWLREIPFPGTARPFAIARDSQGNLYAPDWYFHKVYKFDKDGELVKTWGSFGTGNGEFFWPYGVAVDSADNVYIVDRNNNRVQKFTSSGGYLDKWGGPGSGDGQFNGPFGIMIDKNDTIYVVDQGNHRIQMFDTTGKYLDQWGSYGSGDAQFNQPAEIAMDQSGNLFVTDQSNFRVQKLNSSRAFVTKWGSKGAAYGQYVHPQGISIDGQGNVYIADTNNNRIQKIPGDGSPITSWGDYGSASGQFKQPTSVAVDGNGYVYVVDQGNNRIQKFTSSGGFVKQWGSYGPGDGKFLGAFGIAVDSAGTFVYVTDYNSDSSPNINNSNPYVDVHRVQKFTSEGVFVKQWGSRGSGNNELQEPHGIAIDQHGSVYVADWNNARVQKFTADGVYADTIGKNEIGLSIGVAIDGDDNIYIADFSSHNFRKYNDGGTSLVTVGDFGNGIGSTFWPGGIAVSSDGTSVYLSEYGNSRVQHFHKSAFTEPIATITALSPRVVTQGTNLEMSGRGGDSVYENKKIAFYEWFLDGAASPFKSGTAATNASLKTDNLPPGPHTISFRVRDAAATYSKPQVIAITVLPTQVQTETWTFLLYLDADTGGDIAGALGRNPGGALFRLEKMALPANVRVFALYDGPGNGDSFYLKLTSNTTPVVTNLGESRMNEPQTLIDFVTAGRTAVPSDHYYLAIADHANGLDGIAWDFTSGQNKRLGNPELAQALLAIREGLGRPLDVLHFDGCLMGLIENAYQARGLTNYLVVSQNIAWSTFAYDSYIAAIGLRTSPRELAISVTDRYAEKVKAVPYTITALDLTLGQVLNGQPQPGKLESLVNATDQFAQELQRFAYNNETNRALLNNLRTQVQKFDSLNTGKLTNDQEYVDLDQWAGLVADGVADSQLQNKAAAVHTAIGNLVIREHHASGLMEPFNSSTYVNLDNARGVAIYYPPKANARTYNKRYTDLNFAQQTNWDEFLAAQLGALPFDATDPKPIPAAPIPVPTTPQPVKYRVNIPTVRR